MTVRILITILASLAMTDAASADAVGTAFTFQGWLYHGGTPGEGPDAMVFVLHETPEGSSVVAVPIEFDAVVVEDRAAESSGEVEMT